LLTQYNLILINIAAAKIPVIKKQPQEPEQQHAPKAPVVMRKKEEQHQQQQTPKQRTEGGFSKDLLYKEIIQNQKSENYQLLLNNASITKLVSEYSNLYSDSLEKKYSKILKEIIREKVFSIESEIKSMKEIYGKMKNTKINSEKFKINNAYDNVFNKKVLPDESSKNEKKEFKNIFDLSKNSIKEVKEKIKALPLIKTESLRFNVEYSEFYLNVDVDKSFEIFKENILGKSISSDLKPALDLYAGRFLVRIYQLDKLIYVNYFHYLFGFFLKI